MSNFFFKIVVFFLLISSSYAVSAELTEDQIKKIIDNTDYTASQISDVGVVDQDSLATLLKALEKSGTRDSMERMAESSEKSEKKFDEMLKKMDTMNETTIRAVEKIDTNAKNITENKGEISTLRKDIDINRQYIFDFKTQSIKKDSELYEKVLSVNEKGERNKDDISTLIYWSMYILIGIIIAIMAHEIVDKKRQNSN